MRARGAMVTDMAILVVAADDGVMPQTKEAIAHVRAAKVPIIVALNKIDKPNANPDRVKQELADNGLLIEEYGGDVICVPVSARMRRGIDDLLENILLVADIDPLMANPKGSCVGTVIESRLDKSRGPLATLLVQNGTLHVGDCVVAGDIYGKMRALYDDKGQPITEAPPATAGRGAGHVGCGGGWRHLLGRGGRAHGARHRVRAAGQEARRYDGRCPEGGCARKHLRPGPGRPSQRTDPDPQG